MSISVRFFVLKDKFKIKLQLRNFVSMVESQFNKGAKGIRIDNGPELILSNYYGTSGLFIRLAAMNQL